MTFGDIQTLQISKPVGKTFSNVLNCAFRYEASNRFKLLASFILLFAVGASAFASQTDICELNFEASKTVPESRNTKDPKYGFNAAEPFGEKSRWQIYLELLVHSDSFRSVLNYRLSPNGQKDGSRTPFSKYGTRKLGDLYQDQKYMKTGEAEVVATALPFYQWLAQAGILDSTLRRVLVAQYMGRSANIKQLFMQDPTSTSPRFLFTDEEIFSELHATDWQEALEFHEQLKSRYLKTELALADQILAQNSFTAHRDQQEIERKFYFEFHQVFNLIQKGQGDWIDFGAGLAALQRSYIKRVSGPGIFKALKAYAISQPTAEQISPWLKLERSGPSNWINAIRSKLNAFRKQTTVANETELEVRARDQRSFDKAVAAVASLHADIKAFSNYFKYETGLPFEERKDVLPGSASFISDIMGGIHYTRDLKSTLYAEATTLQSGGIWLSHKGQSRVITASGRELDWYEFLLDYATGFDQVSVTPFWKIEGGIVVLKRNHEPLVIPELSLLSLAGATTPLRATFYCGLCK